MCPTPPALVYHRRECVTSLRDISQSGSGRLVNGRERDPYERFIRLSPNRSLADDRHRRTGHTANSFLAGHRSILPTLPRHTSELVGACETTPVQAGTRAVARVLDGRVADDARDRA